MNVCVAVSLGLSIVATAGCVSRPAPLALDADTSLALAEQSMQSSQYSHYSHYSHYSQARSSQPFEPPQPPRWAIGQPLLQGFFGASLFDQVNVTQGGNVEIDGDDGDLDQLPVVGGGGQWKLAGDEMNFGIEGMFSFSGRANAAAFAFGGTGAVVAIDVDLLLFDVYGGPFVSLDLGDHARIYGAGGPMMQFAEWDQDQSVDPHTHESGDGFGTGLYARAGFEFMIPNGDFIGFGVRWSDTTVDLSGGLGDLEMEGIQVVFTVSRWE